MSDRLEIKITGTNQAHAAFQQVTTDAKSMGTAVEQAGNKSSQSLQQLNQRAAAFGAALGGATLLMGEFAKAAAEDEASQARLEQSVTNTGAAVDDYSASLEAAIKAGQQKAFSDDQTRDALVKLNLATNDTQKSIEELGLAMDLSRAKGISLSQAAEIIGKVYQGQYGALSRMGIILDENATKEQALAEVQKRVAGQAQTYAETQVGQVDKLKDSFSEFTEILGAHAGQLQTIALLLPSLRAGYVAIAGALGALGGGPALAGLAVLAAAGAYSYDLNTNRGGKSEQKTAGFLAGAAGLFNYLTPGNAFSGIQEQFQGVIAGGDLYNIAKTTFGSKAVPSDAAAVAKLKFAGVLPANFQGTIAQAADYINTQTERTTLTPGQYVTTSLREGGYYVQDPISSQWYAPDELKEVNRQRSLAINRGSNAAGAFTMGYGGLSSAGRYGGVSVAAEAAAMRPHGAPMEFDPSAMMARAGGIPAGGGSGFLLDAAANADKTTAALKETLGAYYNLVTGMNVAGGAMQAFKATQDELIDRESVYGQQISEFSSQQNALTAGYDVINEKRANGVELTKREMDYLEKYPDLLQRVSGGVDDATESQGFLAAAYIENMEKGDQLNETMAGQTESTGELVNTIDRLILSLNGVPEEVKTQILLDLSDESVNDLINYYNWLNRIPTSIITELRTVVVEGTGGEQRVRGNALHGGVQGYASGGVVIRAGEAGPEHMSFANGGSAWAMSDSLYNVPRGTYVTPAPASRGRGGGNGLNFNGPVSITVVANDPRQMAAAINEWAVGSSRS